MNSGRLQAEESDGETAEVSIAPSLDYLNVLLSDIPAGRWVAVSESLQKVMACGADVQSVLDAARAAGEPLPLMVRKPEQDLLMYF